MKRTFIKQSIRAALIFAGVLPLTAGAQSFGEYYGRPSYWRPYDQRGINVFETTKTPDSIEFQGPRIRFGAGFTQQFQNLKHEKQLTQ